MIRRWRSRALLAAVIALAATACSVPTQDEPHAVDRDKVPFGLAHDDSVPATTTTVPTRPDPGPPS